MGDRSPSQNSPLSHYHSFFEKNYKILRTHTCSFSAVSLSAVSTTANLCPKASHLDLAVDHLTRSSYRVNFKAEISNCTIETAEEE